MSDYLKSTNFATKDSLPSGNANKIVKGTELDNEFNAIASMSASKADILNPVFSGLLTTDTLQVAGAANVGGALSAASASVAGDITQSGTGVFTIAKGTTAQRPSAPVAGAIRFNTTLGYLENYTGTEWRAVGYVTPANVSDAANTSTGYFQVPRGTTAQRPVSPVEGLVRFNTDLGVYEGYISGAWMTFQTYAQANYTASYVVAAGGGGGGQNSNTAVGSAGGGAGGYLASSVTLTPGTTYYVVVGGGGSGGTSGDGTNGANSSITGIATCIGGGKGGGLGGSGGSGGGSSQDCGAGGSGTAGQGNNGGTNYCRGGGNYGSTGGGGAGGAGANSGGDYVSGSAGGVGLSSTILGASTYFCGGGAGWGQSNYGTGGSGGGGNGNGQNGLANSGGGGGGLGGSGGSGVVILSVPTVNYSGTTTGSPTVTINGTKTVMKFTTSGTYTA